MVGINIPVYHLKVVFLNGLFESSRLYEPTEGARK